MSYQGLYHAIVMPEDGAVLHRRVSVEAEDLKDAKQKLEDTYGAGEVVSVWGGWEAEQKRAEVLRAK